MREIKPKMPENRYGVRREYIADLCPPFDSEEFRQLTRLPTFEDFERADVVTQQFYLSFLMQSYGLQQMQSKNPKEIKAAIERYRLDKQAEEARNIRLNRMF